jgi:hypothetical protein
MHETRQSRTKSRNLTQHDFLGARPWKLFEKLVAAVHRAEMQGAKVIWNDDINGRQFDVTVRFAHGPYSYLTVIECKDWDVPIPVEKVEAFVTKAGDVKAKVRVMVSACGFQSGCFTVAEKHDVELFTLAEINEVSEDLLVRGLVPALLYHSFRLQVAKRREPLSLPEARNILPFLLRKAIIKKGIQEISLEAFANSFSEDLFARATSKSQRHQCTFRPDTIISLPDIISGNTLEAITRKLTRLEFSYNLVQARKMKPGSGLDPYLSTLLNRRYSFINTVTKTGTEHQLRQLTVGHDTRIEAGQFYFDSDTEFYYYCEKVEGETFFMTLIEGYQHANDIRWDIHASKETVSSYVEVTDSKEIRRLSAMLTSFRRIYKKTL